MRKMVYFKEVPCIFGQTQKGKHILIVQQRRYTVTTKYNNFKILCFLFSRVYFEPIESFPKWMRLIVCQDKYCHTFTTNQILFIYKTKKNIQVLHI